MRRIALCTMALPVLLASGWSGHVTSAAGEQGFSVPGLWSGTVYYGDPTNPATPTEQFLATVDQNGTYTIDSTSATGLHPLNPGAKTEERGVWQRHGQSLNTHGFFFDDVGGGPGFSLGRGAARLEFAAHDRLVGVADFDFLLCPAGPLGCPDPADVGAVAIGSGAGPFPVVLRRIQ
jgi:hypothetical protein